MEDASIGDMKDGTGTGKGKGTDVGSEMDDELSPRPSACSAW
jgi:hypothetical protein